MPGFMNEHKWDVPQQQLSKLDRWLLKVLHQAETFWWPARHNNPKEKALIDLLHETMPAVGIKEAPKLHIYKSRYPSASLTTFTKELLLSTSLVDVMSRDQLKAVMGHELMHLNKRWFHITEKIASAGVMVSIIGRLLPPSANLSLLMARQWISRLWEFNADKWGVKAAGPQAMIGALKAIEKRMHEVREEKFLTRMQSKLHGIEEKWTQRITASTGKFQKAMEEEHARVQGKIDTKLKIMRQGWQEKHERMEGILKPESPWLPSELLSTHPSMPRRIANILRKSPESFSEQRKAEISNAAPAPAH